jgi:hypothetical protein
MADPKVSLIVFFLDASGTEQIHPVSELKYAGTVALLCEKMPSMLRDGFHLQPSENSALRALWWGSRDWETDTSYKVNQSFEGCALILVDERLTNYGAEHFNLVADTIFAQLEINPTRWATRPYDIFLSYAAGDSALALELKDLLAHEGLTCFMAEKDIGVATQWQPAIHAALLRARWVLLLLTPRSLERPWVLLEIGAAWALRKDLIPALVHVSPEDLVEPVRRYQARVIETAAQRISLVKELGAS